MKIKHKKRVYAIVGILLLVAIAVFLVYEPVRPYISDPTKIRDFVVGFGAYAPLIFILLQIFQAIIPFVPAPILIILAGLSFGMVKGPIYCLAGMGIGASIVFFIGKMYGKRIVHKHVDHSELLKLNKFIKEHGDYAIFLGRALPLFPNDVVSFGAGLEKIKYRHYIIASLLGFLPSVIVYNLLGDQLIKGLVNAKTLVVIFSIIALILVVYKFRHQIKVRLHNALLWVENKIKK